MNVLIRLKTLFHPSRMRKKENVKYALPFYRNWVLLNKIIQTFYNTLFIDK